MNEMNRKKLYILRLGTFLHSLGMTMSAQELADHLNRNGFRTADGAEFDHDLDIYTLIQATWRWVNNDLGLEDEAQKIAMAFVKPDGTHSWDMPETAQTVTASVENRPEFREVGEEA